VDQIDGLDQFLEVGNKEPIDGYDHLDLDIKGPNSLGFW
jgi:hypothetical protein